jgi:NAD(P)-dependent dehydrogenase (short-subunit alcohol dehydrogenase family)
VPTALITGTGRGLGEELARQYAADGWEVIGTTRRELEMTDREQIREFAAGLKGKPVDANTVYKVAGWAPVGEDAQGEPVWDVVASYLRDKKVIKGLRLNEPRIIGVGKSNPGIADYDGGLS